MVTTNQDRARRRQSVTRARRQLGDGRDRRRNDAVPPRRGGSGYPEWYREQALRLNRAGYEPRPGDPHRTTIARWEVRLLASGQVGADDASGGAPRRCSDQDVALVHFIQGLYPTMISSEMRNMLSHLTNKVWSDTDITRMRRDYNPQRTLTRQRVQSFAVERCELLCRMWRTMPPPYGHVGVHRASMIDIDEMGVYITHTARGFGYACQGSRPRETQVHEKDKLFTVVMGISSSGECFYQIIYDGGINGPRFVEFLDNFLYPYCGNGRVLTWDNLKAHLTPAVDASVAAANGGTLTSLSRVPYMPGWGPIEFIFGVIEAHLRRHQYQANRANFIRLLRSSIRSAVTPATCYNIFKHCGY